jgi:hypothetical protein
MAAYTSPLKRYIALPQDHGSWVFLLSPLLIGLFAGGSLTSASAALITAALAAFLLRQPVSIAVKAASGRRSHDELPAAGIWIVLYGAIAALALASLVSKGFFYVLYLAVPGVPVFVWHLYLVSKRAERRQAGVEIIAAGVLALAAPTALWVGRGTYDPWGWALWVLVWLQSAASIVYAYLRLAQRELTAVPDKGTQWRMAARALVYTSFNFVLTLALGIGGVLPPFIFLPFLLQWLESLWGARHPAVGQKPTAIGVRQLIVSTLFTLLFIVTWR